MSSWTDLPVIAVFIPKGRDLGQGALFKPEGDFKEKNDIFAKG